MIYIYYLTSELDNYQPRYIGYTSGTLEKRLNEHIRQHKSTKKTHKINWINKIEIQGNKIEIFQLETTDTIDNALILERKYIESYTGLTNSTNGGETSKSFIPSVRKKISEANKNYYKNHDNWNKGKHPPNPSKGKSRDCMKGEKNSFFGKHHSEETKNKLSSDKRKYKVFTYDELYNLYVVKNLTQNQICVLSNSSDNGINGQIKKYDLSRIKRQVNGKLKGPIFDKKDVFELYNSGVLIKDIAKKYNVSYSTMNNFIKNNKEK